VSLSLPSVAPDDIVWLHGFTQTGTSAATFRSILAGTGRLVTPDLPGHGANGDVAASLTDFADALVAWLPAGVRLGGYSLGARIALHVALRHPGHIGRLALLGVGLGLASEEERRRRRDRDEQLARQLEDVGVPSFLTEWRRQPLFAGQPDDAEEWASRLANTPSGLASSLRTMGLGTQDNLTAQLPQLRTPTLALAGASDSRFVMAADTLVRSAPAARYSLVPGASHAAHLAQPRLSAQLVARFFSD
jgi:2-succinyl-6-hydroxy-2,4-cyclohexadiene-1-carboxylate synthase